MSYEEIAIYFHCVQKMNRFW